MELWIVSVPINSLSRYDLLMGTAMWNKSRPRDYTSFRTFIFGIKSQTMFPNGVIYEGVSEEPLSFRGESGANDSMVCSLFRYFSCLFFPYSSDLLNTDPSLRQPSPNPNARNTTHLHPQRLSFLSSRQPSPVPRSSQRMR